MAIAALAYGAPSIRAVQKFVAARATRSWPRPSAGSAASASIRWRARAKKWSSPTRPRQGRVGPLLICSRRPSTMPNRRCCSHPSRALAQAVAAAADAQLGGTLARADDALISSRATAAGMVRHRRSRRCLRAGQRHRRRAFAGIIRRDDGRCLARIANAGASGVGAHTPVPLGDYFAGPSHVLPSRGTAKFFRPLSVDDFLKASSLIEYDAAGDRRGQRRSAGLAPRARG